MSTVDVEKIEDAPVTLNANGEVAVQENKDINPQSTEWNTTSDVNPDAVSETGMVEEAKESLEAYLTILEAAGKDGISLQTQAVMNVHLRKIDRTLGYTKSTPALECIDASPRSALYKSTISVEDIKDRISSAGSKLKELFEKMLAWFKEQMQNGKAKLEKLKQAGIQLKEKISKITDSKTEQVEATNRSLFVDGKLELGFEYDEKFLQWYTSQYLIWIGKGAMLVEQNAADQDKLQSVFEQWLGDAPPADLSISGNAKIVYKEGTGQLVIHADGDDPDPVSYPLRSKEELAKGEKDCDRFNDNLVNAMTQVGNILDNLAGTFTKLNNQENGDAALGVLQKVVTQSLWSNTDRMCTIYFDKLRQLSVETSKHAAPETPAE